MIVTWAVLRSDGKAEGESVCFKSSSSMKAYNNFSPPQGYMKVVLPVEQWESLKLSWSRAKDVYEKYLDTETDTVSDLTEEDKDLIKQARPKKYRERIRESDGKMERVEFNNPKDIDWSKATVVE